MLSRISISLMALALTCAAAPLDSERIWTGRNGRTVRGTFFRNLDDGKAIEIVTTDGKIQRIEVQNLSEPDRKLIDDHLRPKGKGPVEDDPAGFREIPPPDRTTLPIIDQSKFGSKASDCVPSSFCNFLLWWDAQGILAIPKRGTFEDKAEWVHSRMARYCGTRNTAGTDRLSALAGFTEYFSKDLSDLATCRTKIDHDIRAENLARHASGATATLLSVTLKYKSGADGAHSVALATADSQGNVTFLTWGARFQGTLKLLEKNEETVTLNGQTVPRSIYEIVINNSAELPKWVQDNEIRFLLDPSKWDGMIVIKPYLFRVAGKSLFPPPDPLFAPPEPKPAAPPAAAAVQVPANIRFTSDVPTEREWLLADGSKVSGRLIRGKTGDPMLRDRQGQERPMPADQLAAEDRALHCFWSGTLGQAVNAPLLDLTYRLTTSRSGAVDFRLSVEGDQCRVDFPGKHRILVLNAESMEFAATRSAKEPSSPPRWATAGKFIPEKLFPLMPIESQAYPDVDEVGRFQTFFDALPGARRANDFPFPSRSITCALTHPGRTVKNPRIDFTRIDSPAAMAGLFQFLYSQSAGKAGGSLSFFNSPEISRHHGFAVLMPALKKASMLPLRIAWSNDVQSSYLDESNRQKTSGSFLLELIAASVPDSFPDGHFSLPAEATHAAPGTLVDLGR